ncbi:MAG: SIMPL domain-containing protein [Pseudomonadota bacterium]|nr:SIMPL domain-containing protein [Pseudomonadota bacterium]
MLRVALIMAVSVGLPGCAERADDSRGVARDEVLLQVVATGRTDTRPDEARFSAGLETIAATAAGASAANNEKMNRVVGALQRLGIKGDDLQTQQITMQRIDYGPNRGRFQATNVMEVRVREIGRAGAAIAATTEAGANLFSGPNLTVSDPEAATRSAYAQAYKAARARAEAYASAAGLKVARVLAIRDGGEGGPASYVGDASVESAAPAPMARVAMPPPVRPGLNASEVHVRADFALAPD